MHYRRILQGAILAVILPIAAVAQTLPAGHTDEQARLALDWAKYDAACRGGAVDGDHDTTLGYCGVRDYAMWRLNETGLCPDDGRSWASCREVATDPLADYPF